LQKQEILDECQNDLNNENEEGEEEVETHNNAEVKETIVDF